MKLDEWLKELERATRKLAPEQGRIARRNARGNIKRCARGVLDSMDQEYPIIKLAGGRPKRARRTLAQVRKQLINDGWVVVFDALLLGLVGELHMPMKRTPAGWIKEPTKFEGHGSGYPGKKAVAEVWIPGWVAHYAPNKTQLLLARKNAKMIQAGSAAARLGSLKPKIDAREIVCPTM